MNKLAELRAHLAAQKGKAKALLDKADSDDRDLNAAELTEFEVLEADMTATQEKIADLEARADRQRRIDAIDTSQPAASVPMLENGFPLGDGVTAALQNRDRTPDPALTGGFKSLAEFRDVRSRCQPSRFDCR